MQRGHLARETSYCAPVLDSGLQLVRIRAMAHGGAGVGNGEGAAVDPRTWLVEGALPGELVEAAIEHEAKSYLRGSTMAIRESASVRVEPPCRYAADCGGCGWQHVAAAAQHALKRGIVEDQLRRFGVPVRAADTPVHAIGYRRRARIHFRSEGDRISLGFHRTRSRQIVDVDTCIVLDPALDRAFQRLRPLAHLLPERGEAFGLSDGAHVVIGLPGVRASAEIDATIGRVFDETLVGMCLRRGRVRQNLGTTELELDGGQGLVPMRANPFTFAQAHAGVNRALVMHVARMAKPMGKRVLELYAGAGNFTRVIAREARRVWTVDDDRESVALLRGLAESYGLSINAKHGVAERLVAKLAAGGTHYDVVVLDPPRRGLGQQASSALADVASERIVYVSCDPATLARDLDVLTKRSFELVDVVTFDMMPMTSEIEIVATLVRVPQ